MDATLRTLHATYRGLPGFVDVYYRGSADPPYRPLFAGGVPEAALERKAIVPVAFDVVPMMPTALPPATPPTTDDIVCTGQIRPGAHLTNGCTIGFLFTDGNDTYASTAGHCALMGRVLNIESVGALGPAVFTTENGGVGDSFALIRIKPDLLPLVNASMCDWGGAVGTFHGPDIANLLVLTTGHGQYIGVNLGFPPRPRVNVGQEWGATSFSWVGGSLGGESGAPMRLATLGGTAANGTALGVLTHSLGVVVPAPTVGYGTRWDRGIELAAAAGIANLRLLTADDAVSV